MEANTVAPKLKGISAKLAFICGEMKRIPKRGRNQQQGYEFATESDIVDFLRPLLAHQNLALIWSCANYVLNDTTTANGRPAMRAEVLLKLTVLDGDVTPEDKGNSLDLGTWPGMALDSGDKALTKAITSAKKYALMVTFLLSTGVDLEDDGEADKPATRQPRGKQTDDEQPPGEYTDAQRKADYRKFFAALKNYAILEPEEAAKFSDDDKREDTLLKAFNVRSMNQLDRKQVLSLINTINKRIERATANP